jgi:inner membrane protein
MQPNCWDVLLLQDTPEDYIARKALLVVTGSVGTARCSRLQQGSEATAPWVEVTSRATVDTPRVSWASELRLSRDAIAERVRGHCRAEALMQFARAPYVLEREGHWLLGDLRFDREAGPGFAEIELDEEGPCPRPVPWNPPRAALLDPR